MKRSLFTVLFFNMFLIFSGCKFQEIADEIKIEKPEKKDFSQSIYHSNPERKWTIMVYMAADNNLENSALEDLYEMECSKLDTKETTVIVLIDRNPLYDASENNWSGTRLYRIETGRKSDENKMISEQLECKELGLSKEKETELDMSADYILSNFISFSKRNFPAEHFGLIMWGHGTGWRCDSNQKYKAFAYDETSKNSLTLHKMGIGLKNGLEELKLDFLGFDTCFSAELEVMYELKDYARYSVGSEGLIMDSGWDYKQIFNEFQNKKNKNVEDFLSIVVNQFKTQYAYLNRSTVTVVRMDKIQNLFDAFDNYCLQIAKKITDGKKRDEIMKKLYSDKNCKTERYSFGTPGDDIYLDIYSLVEQTGGENDFFEAEKQAVVESWASDREKASLGVYFASLVEGNLLSSIMPPAYTKNRTVDQILFVKDSIGYVPCDKTGEGLIDKLFFTTY